MGEKVKDEILEHIIKRYHLDGINEEQLLDLPLIKLPENSIDYLHWIIDIEDIAGVEFSDNQLEIKNYETVGDLIEQVIKLMSFDI